MAWWRRKNEGFVWHDYVRTTILIRREQRRQKIEDIRHAAVAGVKNASRQGAALGAAGAQAAASGIWHGSQQLVLTLWDLITVGAVATWLWGADRGGAVLQALASTLGTILAPSANGLIGWLRQPIATLLLALVAFISAISAAARATQPGIDEQAMLSGAVALAAALGLAVARAPEIAAAAREAARRIGLDRLPIPSLRAFPGVAAGARQAIVLAAMLAGGIALASWLGSALWTSATEPATAVPAGGALTASGGAVEGKAAVASGVRLKVGSTDVRLYGVEAPEASQTCGGRSCAAASKAALQKLVQGKRVQCTTSGRAEDGIASATCLVDGADIAAQLVRAGNVYSDSGLFPTYANAEREARNGKLGVWRSGSDRPAEHRAKAWEEAKRNSPDGCPIKGVVAGDAKTYLTPTSSNYERTKVRPSRGERWFCSEAEARQAGWKPAEAL